MTSLRRPLFFLAVFLFALGVLLIGPAPGAEAQSSTTAPTNVVAAAQSDTSVKVTWNPPTQTMNGQGLTKLSLHDNTGLSGALPAGFVNIDGLQRLAIANTGICVPSGQAFDDWLAGIPDVPGRDGLTRCGS